MLKNYPAGYVGAAAQLAYILVGLPMQMYAIWSAGSAESLSIVTFATGTFASANYAIHGYNNRDWAIMAPQIPNVAFTLFIIGQCLYYR